MDCICTCKGRHIVDLLSHMHPLLKTKVKVTAIHAIPDNCRHVQMNLNAFLGNVLSHILTDLCRLTATVFGQGHDGVIRQVVHID